MLRWFRKSKSAPESVNPQAAPSSVPDISDEQPISDTETTVQNTTWFSRLKTGLSKTRNNFASGIGTLFLGKKTIDEDLFETLEAHLLQADVGVETTTTIIDTLTEQTNRAALKEPQELLNNLKLLLEQQLEKVTAPFYLKHEGLNIILFVGVNGAGKTTTIGKLAYQLKQQNEKVILAAGDTFRAAAVEQLQAWGKRVDVPVIAQTQGSDSASVIYDAIQTAKNQQATVLLADTAGRLHNKHNLMQELKKIIRVIKKADPNAPHEIMLVTDATNGQNALKQAEVFNDIAPLTGMTLTKLDGTAKGGVIFAIADQLNIPVRFIGVGESIEDLQSFEPKAFIDALFTSEASVDAL